MLGDAFQLDKGEIRQGLPRGGRPRAECAVDRIGDIADLDRLHIPK